MYIIELFVKLYLKFKKKPKKKFNQSFETDIIDQKCQHIFMPLDSTKTILACIKCGEILKKKL